MVLVIWASHLYLTRSFSEDQNADATVRATLYAGAFVLWNVAALLAGGGIVFAALSLVAAALLAWQVWTVDATAPDNPRFRFYSNHYVGMALALALLAEWVW